MKGRNPTMQQALWQVPFLMIMAGLLALAVNHWRVTPLPLAGDWSVATRLSDQEGNSLEIPFNEARQLFEKQAAIFLDARSLSQYKDGHISGALSLPWQDVENAFMNIVALLEDGSNIITYCDGESCELSHDLAIFLKDMGFADVRVLINGWTVWRNAGLPTQKSGESDE